MKKFNISFNLGILSLNLFFMQSSLANSIDHNGNKNVGHIIGEHDQLDFINDAETPIEVRFPTKGEAYYEGYGALDNVTIRPNNTRTFKLGNISFDTGKEEECEIKLLVGKEKESVNFIVPMHCAAALCQRRKGMKTSYFPSTTVRMLALLQRVGYRLRRI